MGTYSIEATTSVTPQILQAAMVRARMERSKEAHRVFGTILKAITAVVMRPVAAAATRIASTNNSHSATC